MDLGGIHHYSPNAANDGLSLSYDRESELGEQYCLIQSNENRHCAGEKLFRRGENVGCLGENGKKGARGIGFQLLR